MVIQPPEVSIAIRAYRRRWLGGAIESVLRQTWRDLELIIYDDAGDLEDLAASFGDSRLRYVRAAKKLQASGRYSAAVSECRGSYIGVLDDDDRYEPRFVERLTGALQENPRAGAAYCREIDDVNGTRHRAPRMTLPGSRRGLLRKILGERWVIAPSAMLLRREALQSIEAFQPMPDGVAPDIFVNARLVLCGWDHVMVDEALLVRNWHSDQISHSMIGADYSVATFEHLRLDDPELDRIRRSEWAYRLIMRGARSLVSGDRAAALADFLNARNTDRSSWRFLRRLGTLAAGVPYIGPVAARVARRLHHLVSPLRHVLLVSRRSRA